MTHGITPACAGKTKRTQYHAQSTRDHPRMCGKNLQTLRPMHLMPGSPPHVREKLATSLRGVPGSGITPACAGKTFKIGDSMPRGWDHPRMCGKNSISSNEVSHTPGSPPHVREKRNRKYCLNLCSGITPACAGKTLQRYPHGQDFRDHPRMCGKNS